MSNTLKPLTNRQLAEILMQNPDNKVEIVDEDFASLGYALFVEHGKGEENGLNETSTYVQFGTYES